MTKKTLIKYLSVYQLIGFLIVFILITINCLKEGRMMIFLIPIAGLIILPFLIFSSTGLIDKIKYNRRIKFWIYMGLLFLVIPSLFLPMFYELGGFLITIACFLIGILTLILRKNIDQQLALLNIIGSTLLSTIIAWYLWTV